MTSKPSVVNLQTSDAFAQHLLLMVPFVEGTGQPGIVRGADGVTAGAPTVTTWTGTPGTWSSNSYGVCMHTAAAVVSTLRIGSDDVSGLWLPTGDCTLCVVRGAGVSSHSNSAWLKSDSAGATTLLSNLPLSSSGGPIWWNYGGATLSGGGTDVGTLDPPDRYVLTAGAAGMAIYKNGVKKSSSATPRTRTGSTTSLSIMALTTTIFAEDVGFFQISAMQWDDTTAISWCSDPFRHLSAPVAANVLRRLPGSHQRAGARQAGGI